MLTKEIVYYTITTSKSEYTSSDDEYFDTFEDALNHAKDYAHWYCSQGTCTIKRILLGPNAGTKTYRVTDEWSIVDGKVRSHDNNPYWY